MFKSKKERNKENMKQETKVKGISLITLVITIIIIIILAGAIILSLTNSDIIGKAGMAKASNDFSSIRQMVEMAKADVMLNDGIVSVTPPEEYANDIHISAIGGIFLKPGGTKITDPEIIEKAMTVMGAAYMPTGFTHLEGTLDEGIVIKDANNNEFVWVPVLDDTEFIRVGNFTTWAAIGGSNIAYNSASTTETAEYNAMKTSVTKYKGFYIARYEAGKAIGTTPGITGATPPLSKPGVDVWNNIAWDGAYVSGLGNDQNNGAVKVARAMYPVGTTPVGSPVSTLIYGEQWDAAMRYMKDVPNIDDPTKKYILDSTSMGYYAYDSNWYPINPEEVQKTASNSKYRVKNIYDMAGNVYEWTMEAYSTYSRVVRGGSFDDCGANGPASYRDNVSPVYSRDYIGFRPALYIK